MELFLTRRFVKRFEALPQAVQRHVHEALMAITREPAAGKRLSGPLHGEYSWRVGRYRIICCIEEGRIVAETVGHRKDVYR